jgi:threonylcarbamoyladenosine tRNA methylthiotransferase MtaB
MSNFIIKTLGCKVNQFESEAIAEQLIKHGWNSVQKYTQANVCIINTCTVTEKASMQSRQIMRQAIRNNPKIRLIITGCYAQTEFQNILKIDGIAEGIENGLCEIICHSNKHKIAEAILANQCSKKSHLSNIVKNSFEDTFLKEMPINLSKSRTRALLKIQDGCNAFCTYCIVPLARGQSRSLPSAKVLNNLTKLKDAGYLEVILSGIHLGAYGLDLFPKTCLFELLQLIDQKKCIKRLRLSSIEPKELSLEIIKLVANSNIFCNHFHIPLQSGDDNILKRMKRPYDSKLYKNIVYNIHETIKNPGIGADVLVGFPGETEKSFEKTYSLIKELPITYLHVFPFSPRKNTLAATYSDQVPLKVQKERCQRMILLSNEKKTNFYKKFIGQSVEILIENKTDKQTGLLKGLTSSYIPIFVDAGDNLGNTIKTVKIEKINNNNQLFATSF